jgi:hypothetical protein
MKYFWFLLCSIFELHALSSGDVINPYMLHKGICCSDENVVNSRTGLEGFWVYNMRLDSSFEKIYMGGVLFDGILNVKERVDLYFKIGPSQLQVKPQLSRTQKTSYRPLYMTGFKAELIEIKDTFLGIDVQYAYFTSPLKKDSVLNSLTKKNISAIYKDWQITLGVTQKIGFFYPYLSAACENIKLYLKRYPLSKRTFQSHYRYGPILGITFSTNDYVFFNCEARFYNLYGIFFETQIRF